MRKEKLGFIPVSREKKCYRCAWRGIACDGNYPCSRCDKESTRRSCRPQGVEDSPSCIQCCSGTSKAGRSCDRGKPCKRCISKNFNCSYEAQDGLLIRTYHPPEARLPMGFSTGPLKEGELSDDECVRCQLRKLHCGGDQPCESCVRRQGTHSIATCNYRRSDGTFESWAVRPFKSHTSEGPQLRDNYTAYAGRNKRTEELRDMRTRLQSKKDNAHTKVDSVTDTEPDKEKHQLARDSIGQSKFGLSAYNRKTTPLLEMKPGSATDDKYYDAKIEELKSHQEKGTWQIVPTPDDVKPVTSRWVNTTKFGPEGQFIKHKSRLVARGFQQEEGIDYEETFASVVKSSSTPILLALASALSWQVHQGDVKTAFLNSNLDKPVYMRPPKDMKVPYGFCLKVVRALYGLKQSPRAWYNKLS